VQSGAGTNYQVQIIVHYGSGTDGGDDVYLKSLCRTDFGDVRFTDNDGTTPLDYWMQTKVNSDHADFWVEVKDDLSTNPATIYIYYGKSDATTTSSIYNTMVRGDEFDNQKTEEFNKYANNPVITGAGFPSVLRRNSTHLWMYYTKLNEYNIWWCQSTDGGYTWTDHTIAINDVQCRWSRASVIGDELRVAYISSTLASIKYANASWSTTNGTDLVIQGTLLEKGSVSTDWDYQRIHDPAEFKKDNTYYLYYVGRRNDSDPERIGLATSTTGLPGSYTKQGQVLQPDFGTTNWDFDGLFDPSVYEYDAGKYIMFFTGWDGKRQKWGYATSTDLTSFTKYSGNPISWTTQPSWEGTQSIEPTFLIEDNKYIAWYRDGHPTTNKIGRQYFFQDTTSKLPITNQTWLVEGTGIIEEDADGYLHIKATASSTFARVSYGVRMDKANKAFEYRWRHVNDIGEGQVQRFCPRETDQAYFEIFWNPSDNKIKLYTLQSGSWAVRWTSTNSFTLNTWYRNRVYMSSSNIRVYIYNDSWTQLEDSGWIAVDSGSGYDSLAQGTTNDEGYWDYYFCRKYVDPEPSHGSWGAAEIFHRTRAVESCDGSGATKNEFNLGDDVYVVGSGYASSLSYVLKIVSDVDWSDGMKIPSYIVKTTVSSDSSGNIAPTLVWNGATPGKYDIIVDVNGNDEYDPGIDALDDFDVDTAGFFVIPEYWLGTILGLTGFFAAFGTYYISKRRRIYN